MGLAGPGVAIKLTAPVVRHSKVYIPPYSCGLSNSRSKWRGITDLGEAGLRAVAGNGDFFATPIFFCATQRVCLVSECLVAGRDDRESDLKGKMMKKITGVLCALAMSAGILPAHAQDSKLDDRLNSASAVIDEVMQTPDRGIPQSILAGASCVVVVPHYKKAAFLVGAQYGQGVATCRTPHGWSAPVFVRLEGGSFGWQLGGQSTDLILVAMNQGGLESMLKSKFKLGADASAAAGPVGRNAAADTDVALHAEFLTYSRARGLFAGLDLSGTVLSQNAEDTRTEYGADVPFEGVLHGMKPTPPNAKHFVHTVARYFVVSSDNH
jgi:lipid-binding SYLF domain-containing protein